MRTGKCLRKTKETTVEVNVNLDGSGTIEVNTGVMFFDHLIKTLAVHSQIDINVTAKGDLKHHVIEDVAICLGESFRNAIGEGLGIHRFGYAIVPMDDALAFAAIDLVRRPYHKIDLKMTQECIEDTTREDIIHFFETLASFLQCNVHVWVQYGTNEHHCVEAAFKALALSLRQAVVVSSERKQVPSAKGLI
ncbi:MAG: imidazoleglycerol-phosphate dehydratase HisB [Candidatus Bathyarchaeota archaeon]